MIFAVNGLRERADYWVIDASTNHCPPVETTPVETTPVETTPVETTRVETILRRNYRELKTEDFNGS